MFGHNVVRNDFEHYDSTDPHAQPTYGTFLVPTTMQGMLLRPLSSTRDDGQPFSNQYMSSHDIGAYTLLALSPAGASVDPSLRANSNIMSSPLATRRMGRNEYLGTSPMRAMRPLQEQAQPKASATPPNESLSLTLHQAQASREPRRTKRYQYWTPEEDKLVQDLREIGGWTWKSISSELHRRLGGVHTWQAVQMRYLRTSKNKPPVTTQRVEKLKSAKVTPKIEPECAALCEPSNPVSLSEIEKAVNEDWHGRWLRISAKLGADLDQQIVGEKQVGHGRPSPELQLYMTTT